MEKEIPLKLNKNYNIVTANDLIKGKQTMSLREAQLLYIAIAQVSMQDINFKTYTTTIPELASFMEISPQSLYRDIENICDSLLKRVIKIKTAKDNWDSFQWINRATFRDGRLTIRLSDEIKPYLLELERYFSQLNLGTILTFSSYYTTRLYQILKCDTDFNGKEEWKFTCNELREMFQTGKKYDLNRNLLKYTINVALNELNNSDYAYIWDYEEIKSPSKRGKPTLVGVRFKAMVFANLKEKEFYLNKSKPIIEEYNNPKVEETEEQIDGQMFFNDIEENNIDCLENFEEPVDDLLFGFDIDFTDFMS